MRLQFHSGDMYDRRRSVALSSPRNADFDLIDIDGTVLQSFQITVTMEPDDSDYLAAMDPSIDVETRRFNAAEPMPRKAADARAKRTMARAQHAAEVKPEQPRTTGNVLMW